MEEAGLLAGAPPSVQVIYKGLVVAGTPVAQAHGNWTPEGAIRAATPPGAPRLPDDGVCAAGFHLIEVELRERPSGGMSSYYGFEGRFVSVLFDEVSWSVVDVRAEVAR